MEGGGRTGRVAAPARPPRGSVRREALKCPLKKKEEVEVRRHEPKQSCDPETTLTQFEFNWIFWKERKETRCSLIVRGATDRETRKKAACE